MTVSLVAYPDAVNALPPELGARLWPHAATVRVRAGRTLIALGAEDSSDVYIVLEGRVQVALFSSAGREVILRSLGPAALVGELSAIDGQPRSASVIAVEDCVLASVSGAVFRSAVSETPAAALWLFHRLAEQVRELSEKVFELNALRVPSRLHCEILRICHTVRDGMVTGIIDPFPTHAELAARIGTNREAVTREIGFLTGRGVLTAKSRRITLVDVPKLTEMIRDAAGDLGNRRSVWPIVGDA